MPRIRIRLRMPSTLGNAVALAVVVVAAWVVVGLLVFFLRIVPMSHGEPDFSTEFAWDQLIAALAAVSLAVYFGVYAAQSVGQFERAQREEENKNIRNVYISLLKELQDNRVNLLLLERRLNNVPIEIRWRLHPGLQRKTYDALLAGPI